jgi:hypothetical protein
VKTTSITKNACTVTLTIQQPNDIQGKNWILWARFLVQRLVVIRLAKAWILGIEDYLKTGECRQIPNYKFGELKIRNRTKLWGRVRRQQMSRRWKAVLPAGLAWSWIAASPSDMFRCFLFRLSRFDSDIMPLIRPRGLGFRFGSPGKFCWSCFLPQLHNYYSGYNILKCPTQGLEHGFLLGCVQFGQSHLSLFFIFSSHPQGSFLRKHSFHPIDFGQLFWVVDP